MYKRDGGAKVNCEAILNLIALTVIPIFAVIIGHYLQDRSKKRDDKMYIFKILMTNRIYGWTNESVWALNIIDIVFADDVTVIEQWKIYYDKLCIQNPTNMDLRKIETERNKLLEIMANSLGYKNKITWETIQNPYIPKGMLDSMAQQQEFQNGQSELMKKILQGNIGGQQENGKNENGIV